MAAAYMVADGEAGETDNTSLIKLLGSFHKLPRGCPKPFEIDAALKACTAGIPATVEVLGMIQAQRNTVERVWGSGLGEKYLQGERASSAAECVSALDAYLPLLQVNASQEPGPVPFASRSTLVPSAHLALAVERRGREG